MQINAVLSFYARISYMVILFVCLSVCLSQPGIDPRPVEIRDFGGFHHMIA